MFSKLLHSRLMAYNPSPYLQSRARKLRYYDYEEDTKYYKYLIYKIHGTDPKLLNNFDKREYEEYYNQSKIFKQMADEHQHYTQHPINAETISSARSEKRFYSETPRAKNETPVQAAATPTAQRTEEKSRPSSTELKRIQFLEREVEYLNEISKYEAKLKENAVKELQMVKQLNEQLRGYNSRLLQEVEELKAKMLLLNTNEKPADGSRDDSSMEAGDYPPDSIPNELLEYFDF